MDRYQRVEKPRAETPISENEIRVTTQGKMRNYITYATTLLQVLRLTATVFHFVLVSFFLSFFPSELVGPIHLSEFLSPLCFRYGK
jgi:multisubunit Na+/H+ antiporter MnhC subunit